MLPKSFVIIVAFIVETMLLYRARMVGRTADPVIDELFAEDNSCSVEIARYTALWRAVIMQAAMDLTTNSRRTEDHIAKYQARMWFLDRGKDFYEVCRMADYSANYVQKMIMSIIARADRQEAELSTNNKEYLFW